MSPSEARYNEVLDVLKPLAPEFGLVAAVNLEGPTSITGVVEILTQRKLEPREMEVLLSGFFYKLIYELHRNWAPQGSSPLEVSFKLSDYLGNALAQYLVELPC
jgi:hypothetical protein